MKGNWRVYPSGQRKSRGNLDIQQTRVSALARDIDSANIEKRWLSIRLHQNTVLKYGMILIG